MDYEKQLQGHLDNLRGRIRRGKVAQNIKANAPDLIELIDAQRQVEIFKITKDKPVSYDEYLEAHGAIRAYAKLRDVIEAADSEVEAASQEAKEVNEQLANLRKQSAK